MIKSIKKFKNNDEIIKDLELRKLVFSDLESKQIFKTYLSQYGYFSFVKVMSNDLMYSDIENKIYKKEFTSNNLRYLFDIDRNISVIIFKFFRSIEFLLNSSLLKIISKKIDKYAKCPYIAALSSEDFFELFPYINEEIKIQKKPNKNICINLWSDIYKNLWSDDYYCKEAIEKNKNNEDNEIKQLIQKGWFKQSITGIHPSAQKSDWEYLDIFSLFQILSFSQLKRLYSYLSISSKKEVVRGFFIDYNPGSKYLKLNEKSFTVLINTFSKLRNILMHNGCLIKFSFEIPENEVKEELEKYFKIEIPDSVIKLNEIIAIMEVIIKKDLIYNEIKDSIKNKFKSRTQRPDKISPLILDIIENDSRIKIDLK